MDISLMVNDFEAYTGIKFMVGPELLEMPDLLGLVTRMPGIGLLNDGIIDQVQFQVAIRGKQNDFADVEAYAKQIDDLIIFGDYPHEKWGGWVISAYRSGGGPSPQLSVDMGRRVTFICTYTAQEAID